MNFPFEMRRLLEQVPAGRVTTCSQMAQALGDRRAAMAVFRFILAKKQSGMPLHRVVKSDGTTIIPGAAGLLRREGHLVKGGRVLNLRKVLFDEFAAEPPLVRLRREQIMFAKMIKLEDSFGDIGSVGGVDVSYWNDRAFGSCVVLEPRSLRMIDEATTFMRVTFPYIPTYLAYREFPVIARLVGKLKILPSILLIDGHGILHPAGLGIASFAGLKLDLPTIGVAKSLLHGKLAGYPKKLGDHATVGYKGKILGYALRTTSSKRCIYISPGHRVGLESSLRITKGLCISRLPEPLRLADVKSKQAKKKSKKDEKESFRAV